MRFAVVAVPASGADWVRQCASIEADGWDTLLVPDTLRTASPFPALAAAAAATTTLRLRTWVLAAPLRNPATTVREVAALQQLSDGRFELGIGTGRPDAAGEATELGTPWPEAPGRRREHLSAVVQAVRTAVTPTPPVVVTASGPRMLAAAADLMRGRGDRIGLALSPFADAAALAEVARPAREALPEGAGLTYQFFGVGDRLMSWVGATGLTADRLRDAGSVALLPADPHEAADLLGSWSAEFGIDEVIVPAELATAALPVVNLAAAGRID